MKVSLKSAIVINWERSCKLNIKCVDKSERECYFISRVLSTLFLRVLTNIDNIKEDPI